MITRIPSTSVLKAAKQAVAAKPAWARKGAIYFCLMPWIGQGQVGSADDNLDKPSHGLSALNIVITTHRVSAQV